MNNPRIKKLQRNLYLIILFFVFSKTGFWIPILFFYLNISKNFSSTSSLFLIGISTLSTSIFEIPTGAVADKISRKISLTIGTFLNFLCVSLLLLTNGFLPIFFIMVGRGMGISFTSGAEDSLLYDTLKELGIPNNFKKQLNITRTYNFIQIGITTFLSGILSDISLSVPILLTSISYLTASIMTLFMIEPQKLSVNRLKLEESYLKHIKKSIQTILSMKSFRLGLMLIFLITSIMEAILSSNKNIISPILNNLGIGIKTVGIASSIIYFTKAFGALAASKFNKVGNEINEINLSVLLCILCLSIIGVSHNAFVSIIMLAIIIGIDPFIISNLYKLVNDLIPSSRRATIISFLSLFAETLSAIYLPLFGLILVKLNLLASMLYINLILVIISIVFFINNRIKNKNVSK